MKRTLEQAIKANGLDTEIRNIVFHLLRASAKGDTKNPIQCVRDATELPNICENPYNYFHLLHLKKKMF